MARVLVVANETLGGRKLVEAVRERAQSGDATFIVIAPQNQPKSGYVVYQDAVRSAAQHRVDTTVAQLSEVGVQATGEVMDPDPFTAITDAVREFDIDEVIVSTHPETRSGWLRRDLVERVQQATGLPVAHVVVDLDAERQHLTHTLVVANRTLGGAPLVGLLKGKAAEKSHRFTVIVPLESGDASATPEAQARLAAVLESLREEGLAATGAIGDPDPFTAITNALQFYAVDEIVISTHPATRSGWLRTDLVERVRRSTAIPVEHVVVDLEAARTGA